MDVRQWHIGKLAVIVQTRWRGPEGSVCIFLPPLWHQSQQFCCLVTWVPVLCSASGLPEIKRG